MRERGKVSWFGGPDDEGVSASEGLAIYEPEQVSEHPELFLEDQPAGTTGLARRLNPDAYYVAMRWDYDLYSKDELRDMLVLVYAPMTGRAFLARPTDWGPHEDTDRLADISPGLLEALGISTDDEVEVIWPVGDIQRAQRLSIAISSGHSTIVRGASGLIDEVDEATRVVDSVGRILRAWGFGVFTFHDTVSTSQNENLNRIVDWHNSKSRHLDVSVHFNANETTDAPMGTECLYLTQEALARGIATAVSEAGELKYRGPKYRDDLFVLNNTDEPCVLIEVCFVDSQADVDAYELNYLKICRAIASAIAEGIPTA